MSGGAGNPEEDYLRDLMKGLEDSSPEEARALVKRILAEVENSGLPQDKTKLTSMLLRAAGIGIDTHMIYGRPPEEGAMELPSLDTEPERRMADQG